MLLFLPSQDGSSQGLGQRRSPLWSKCLLRSPNPASLGPTLSLGFNLSCQYQAGGNLQTKS